MTLTEQLAEYTLKQSSGPIPSAVKALGQSFFIDCLGCMIAGSQGEPSRIAAECCKDLYGVKGEATVLATGGLKLDACSAALINGISSHYHDYDDVLPTLNGHPTAAVLPAVLALAEKLNKSGGEALAAYITGVEVVDIMARGFNQAGHIHYSKGWHSTSSLGIFGATAASALLLGLNSQQLVNAFGLAASESSGLQGNFGTMAKAFHAGRAAEKGIWVAEMAARGYGANPSIMEVTGGFADVTTGTMDMAAMTERMNSGASVFLDPGLTMKPYPCCKCNHNPIDGIYELMHEHGLKPQDIKKVIVGVQPFFIGCLKYPAAATALEKKFSLNYNVAFVMVYGKRPAIRDYPGGTVTDAIMLENMNKVEMVHDPSIAGEAYANGTWDTKMTVVLNDDRQLNTRVLHSRGESANPLSKDEVLEKFRDCMSITVDAAKAEPVIELLDDLEKLDSINKLMAVIEAAGKQ